MFKTFFRFSLQIRTLGDNLKHGDVILSNHPIAGGTHLPDLTVITPVRETNMPINAFHLLLGGINCTKIVGLTVNPFAVANLP